MKAQCTEVALSLSYKKRKVQVLTCSGNASPTYILRGVEFEGLAAFCMSLLGFSFQTETSNLLLLLFTIGVHLSA